MKQQISYKNFFINYAIFVLIVAFVFGILVYFVKVSQKSWDQNLKAVIENTLAESEPDTWDLGKVYRINNPLGSGSACYEARNKKNGENYKIAIIRLQTFYGPQAGIYIIDSQYNASFKCYASLHGRCAEQLQKSYSGRRVEYWKHRLEDIFKKERGDK